MASIKTYETSSGERRYLVRWRVGNREASKGGFRRKRDALRYKADVETRKEMGHLYRAAPLTLGEFLDGWLSRYERKVDRASSHRRRADALRALPDSLRAVALPELDPADVEDAVTAVAERAPRQAQLCLATLKLALRNAVERKQVIDPGIFTIRAPSAKARPPRFLTLAEVEELAGWMDDQANRLVRFAALTGARQGEIFRLRRDDVDLDAGTALIHGEVKTEKSLRTLDLAPSVVELLAEQLASHESRLVFPAPRGGEWSKDNFMARVFRPAVKRAGLEPLRFHDLRHTFASLSIEAGNNVKVIADQLGHGDGGALVLSRYGHLYKGATKDAALRLDALVRKSLRADARGEHVESVRNHDRSGVHT